MEMEFIDMADVSEFMTDNMQDSATEDEVDCKSLLRRVEGSG